MDVDEKLFRKVRISDSEPKFTIDTLVLLSKEKMRGSLLDELWKAHFIDRKVRLAFEGLLGEDDASLIRFICKKASGITASEARASLKRAKITIDFPLPEVLEQPPVPVRPLVMPKAGVSPLSLPRPPRCRRGAGGKPVLERSRPKCVETWWFLTQRATSKASGFDAPDPTAGMWRFSSCSPAASRRTPAANGPRDPIPTRLVGEQHVREDLAFIRGFHYCTAIVTPPWVDAVPIRTDTGTALCNCLAQIRGVGSKG